MEKLVRRIVLPVRLPTWNRILGMNRWQRKKLRELIHLFVYISIPRGKDSRTLMECQLKPSLMDWFLEEYYRTIVQGKSQPLPTLKKKYKGEETIVELWREEG